MPPIASSLRIGTVSYNLMVSNERNVCRGTPCECPHCLRCPLLPRIVMQHVHQCQTMRAMDDHSGRPPERLVESARLCRAPEERAIPCRAASSRPFPAVHHGRWVEPARPRRAPKGRATLLYASRSTSLPILENLSAFALKMCCTLRVSYLA